MDDDAQIFSVIGGAKRSGRWRVPASVPEGAEVRPSGMAILGSARKRRRARKAAEQAGKAAPVAGDGSAPARHDDGGPVDLLPIDRHERERPLVDLKPVDRRPPISAPNTPSGTDDDSPADAPDLFDRPRISAPTVDPEPADAVDDPLGLEGFTGSRGAVVSPPWLSPRPPRRHPRRNAGRSSGKSSTKR